MDANETAGTVHYKNRNKSKKSQKESKESKEPDHFFAREKWKAQKADAAKKAPVDPRDKRTGTAKPPRLADPPPIPRPAPTINSDYDAEAIKRMRNQLENDADAFLLNNILLSVQFFKNYEQELYELKNNAPAEPDGELNELMAEHHKHAFSADRLQERVHEHVRFMGLEGQQPLGQLRTFVVHDNIEACEPGDESDYSAVLDVPYYKMLVERSSTSGYVKLRKLEILQNENVTCLEDLLPQDENDKSRKDSQESNNGLPSSSTDTDVDRESILSEDSDLQSTKDGMALLLEIKAKLDQTLKTQQYKNPVSNMNRLQNSKSLNDVSERKLSGGSKPVSKQVMKGDITNINHFRKNNVSLKEVNTTMNGSIKSMENKVTTSKSHEDLFHAGRRLSGLTKYENNAVKNAKISNLPKFKETTPSLSEAEENSDELKRLSSNSGLTDYSSADSDYGYAKILEQSEPKPLQRSTVSKGCDDTCVLPLKCFTLVNVEVDVWDDENENDKENENEEGFKELYDKQYFLNSKVFMSNFVNNFMSKLGKSLGFSSYSITEALTQGATIYCDTYKHSSSVTSEIIPAIATSWPNSANEWLIRERKIINNPRTNFSYQWPTKTMVNKTRGFGCILIPLGHRSAKNNTPDQALQWKITFPAAERYLESCLAHSQVRCYLFTLGLLKRFMENQKSKVGLDSSHIKTHLFWQCEDNYAKWPEDRLGETLRNFLISLYRNFQKKTFPDYFIAEHDHLKGWPNKIIHKVQWQLADIMESPVMHVLAMIQKIQYTTADFYPEFDCMGLYRILTTKNVLQLLNPNIPNGTHYYDDDMEDETEKYTASVGFWEKAKEHDKHYQWKKELQRQEQMRRNAVMKERRKKSVVPDAINEQKILPQKMEQARRRLVLEFFIPHFIAMGECSDKFEATKQGIIYLEQAKRLTIILMGEAGGEFQSNNFLSEIQEKLTALKMKMAKIGGPRVPKRNETFQFPGTSKTRIELINKHKPSEYVNINNIDGTPPPSPSTKVSNNIAKVDVHIESRQINRKQSIVLKGDWSDEESKL